MSDKSKKETPAMVELAIHQLVGFSHASQGYNLISLAESMALSCEEWEIIKDDGGHGLTESMIDELNEFFYG